MRQEATKKDKIELDWFIGRGERGDCSICRVVRTVPKSSKVQSVVLRMRIVSVLENGFTLDIWPHGLTGRAECLYATTRHCGAGEFVRTARCKSQNASLARVLFSAKCTISLSASCVRRETLPKMIISRRSRRGVRPCRPDLSFDRLTRIRMYPHVTLSRVPITQQHRVSRLHPIDLTLGRTERQ